MKKYKVNIWESERGWGRKLDEVKEFDTEHEACEFVIEYNAKNVSRPVPDVYTFAELA